MFMIMPKRVSPVKTGRRKEQAVGRFTNLDRVKSRAIKSLNFAQIERGRPVAGGRILAARRDF